MNKLKTGKNLLLGYEVLRARLDIRDFFLKYTVREVYENIGQVLSVARMQLADLEIKGNKKADENMPSSGSLVSQAIRDLRTMCKSFYPDADIIKDDGFIESLSNMISILYPDAQNTTIVKGERKEIQTEPALIIFKILKEILTAIKEIGGNFINMEISYAEDEVKCCISYMGLEIDLIEESINDGTAQELTLQQRAELIEGELSKLENNNGTNRLILISPLKLLFL